MKEGLQQKREREVVGIKEEIAIVNYCLQLAYKNGDKERQNYFKNKQYHLSNNLIRSYTIGLELAD